MALAEIITIVSNEESCFFEDLFDHLQYVDLGFNFINIFSLSFLRFHVFIFIHFNQNLSLDPAIVHF